MSVDLKYVCCACEHLCKVYPLDSGEVIKLELCIIGCSGM